MAEKVYDIVVVTIPAVEPNSHPERTRTVEFSIQDRPGRYRLRGSYAESDIEVLVSEIKRSVTGAESLPKFIEAVGG